jgi:hypothetical protein
MVVIDWIYLLFVSTAIGWAMFKAKRAPDSSQSAVIALYIGGLALLPAAAYRDIGPGGVDVAKVFPVWFIGILIPTPFLVINKGWIAPLTALICAALLDRQRLANFKPKLLDVPIVLFCLLPVIQRLIGTADPAPPTLTSTLLLAGCWLLPWIIGRIYLNNRAGRIILIDRLILFSIILVPISIIEGISEFRFHEFLYGTHPFAKVGTARYIGFRPLAFFEDGNQYGIWMCCAALAAWWRFRFNETGRLQLYRFVLAFILLLTALASQSIGAIILMIIFMIWLEVAAWLERHRWIYQMCLFSTAAVGGLLLSGALTIASLGATTERIERIAMFFFSIGRQSLQWRIGRARDNLPQLQEFIVAGRGRWDWYTTFRPWDLPLMLVGFFGLIGLALVVMAIGAAVWRRRWQRPARKGSTRYLFLALIGMAIADAFMNTYVFLPALAMLGGLAPAPHPSWRRAGRPHPYLGLAAPAPAAPALAAGGSKPD